MATRAGESTVAAPDHRNRWLVLAVVLSGFFMILLDGTIVNVAIPPIQADLGTRYDTTQWVVSGYALAYGLLLIPAGRLGDRFGHRPLFLIGLAGFVVASALCGTAANGEQLVAWRVVQGLTAGLMNPAILAVIQAVFPPPERGTAFAYFGATAGIATAMGPLLGGVLIAWNVAGLDWRAIFLLNIPVGLVVLVAAVRLVPDHRGRGGSLDPVGLVIATAALLLLTYPLIQGREAGWAPWTLISMIATVPVVAGFVGWQIRRIQRGTEPLIDVRLFRNRAFAAGTLITLCYFAGFISLQFVLSIYLQMGLGRSALTAGLVLVPFAAGTFASSSVSNRLAHRIGGRRMLHLGSALVALGFAGLIAEIAAAGATTSDWSLMAVLLLAGVGSGMVTAPITNVVLAGVPGSDAGAAGAVLATAQRIGHALGIAVAGTALFSALGLSPDQAAGGGLAEQYSHAIQVAALYSLGAVVLTYLLVFMLPRDHEPAAAR